MSELCPSQFSSSVLSQVLGVVVVLFGHIFLFQDIFVSSFRLHDEAKHFALRRPSHSFVFFCGCPGSRGVAHCRGYDYVEKPKSMSELVSSRCEVLSALAKRRPGSPDSISDFGRLLLQERNHLAHVSHAFSSCQDFDLNHQLQFLF